MSFTRQSVLRAGSAAGIAGLSGCIGVLGRPELEELSVELWNETAEPRTVRVRLQTEEFEEVFDQTLATPADGSAKQGTALTGTEYVVGVYVYGRRVYRGTWTWSGCVTDSVVVELHSHSDVDVRNRCHND